MPDVLERLEVSEFVDVVVGENESAQVRHGEMDRGRHILYPVVRQEQRLEAFE